jgi:hypothetical protein
MSNFFESSLNDQLYVASTESPNRGFSGFVLPASSSTEGYSVSEALSDSSLRGSFILSAYSPNLATKEDTDIFVEKLLKLLGDGRYIIWISDLTDFNYQTNTIIWDIASDGSSSIRAINFPMVNSLSLQFPNQIKLSALDDGLALGDPEDTGKKIYFTGDNAPDNRISYATEALLPFSGTYRGCVSFPMNIGSDTLVNKFKWGFQFLIPLADYPNQSALSEFLPLAEADPTASDDNPIGFDITIDPTDVFNLAFNCKQEDICTLTDQYNSRRTFFDFTGKNSNNVDTIISSYYFTTAGEKIQLAPDGIGDSGLRARLLINNGEQFSASLQQSHFASEGDFILLAPDPTVETSYSLQCGLQGTEFFNVHPKTNANVDGDRIRFIGNQPSFAPVFPLQESSPILPPIQPNTPLLNQEYMTSWATVVHGSSKTPTSYVAQPKGSALFGTDLGNNSTVIGHSTPNFTFNANSFVLFPLLPYTAVQPHTSPTQGFSLEQIEDFERLIISPIRKQNINSMLIESQVAAREVRKNSVNFAEEPTTQVTTPSGLIASLLGSNNNPDWKAIYLAQNQVNPGAAFQKMFFENPDDSLVQAFQTSDLFLVIGNGEKLGTPVNSAHPKGDATSNFYNEMFIGDWTMRSSTGTQNKYNDYNNIIIVKGRKGKLYDPEDPSNSLVANFQKWSAKDEFAAPSTIDSTGTLTGPDSSQLVILSQWMQTYFEKAHNQTDQEYFGDFNTIATDENWTGTLVLAMDITSLPKNLNGILSGVRFPNEFRAHHLGVNITPVKHSSTGPEITTPSSMFGLIYYNDPDFIQQENPVPIEPDLADTYDFTLLNLKVLFKNSAVQQFQSYAQLTTNNYFGTSVDHMGIGGNSFNTMILKGSLQFKGEEAIFSLGTEGVNTFYFDSPIVNKVEITSANFSTLGTNSDGDLTSWFAITGFWDFKKLTNTTVVDGVSKTTDFDLLSFGSAGDQNNGANDTSSRDGLLFNGLGIQMTSPPYVSGQTDPLPKTMTFETSKITFDQKRSKSRPNSIYINFALDLQSLAQGASDTTPAGKDYLTVITDLKVSPFDGSNWVGLTYQLNMGTPGKLAGDIGLNSTMLIAWDPNAKTSDDADARPPVFVGVKLPGTGGGAKLISLQTVLSLSIGQLRLSFSDKESSFLLMFTDIALKFLGLLKIPPNGSTLFYLFGNPQSEGKASGLGWYAMYNKDEKKKIS